MILYRCFACNERAQPTEPDGAVWFPRVFQGEGRHDNPDVYGCLYLAERAVSPVVEQLARFRGQRLGPAMLRRRGLPLALAELALDADAELIDLDDPVVLDAERLLPSHVATRRRDMTQPQARLLYERHARAVGLRWWSSYEALWINVTLFDRGAGRLRVRSVRSLAIDDPAVIEAAQIFGFQVR